MKFILRRLFWIVVTLWAVDISTFFMMQAVPGGPFQGERKLPPIIQRNLRAYYHLDDPLPLQYWNRLTKLAHLDFGPSMRMQDFTVNNVIAEGLPVSASLGILALTFALIFGLTVGVVSAARRNSAIDVIFMGAAAVGIAVPSFVLASLAIIVFVFWLAWLPAGGWGTLEQLLLPALCLGAPVAAYIARLTRAGMLDVLSLDYIRTAYSKGLSEPVVLTRHALQGALLPVISYLGPAAAGLLTGSVVLEKIFNIPGLGSHFVESALQRDYPLSQGIVLVYTLLLLTLNTLVDLSYALIDPRVKLD